MKTSVLDHIRESVEKRQRRDAAAKASAAIVMALPAEDRAEVILGVIGKVFPGEQPEVIVELFLTPPSSDSNQAAEKAKSADETQTAQNEHGAEIAADHE